MVVSGRALSEWRAEIAIEVHLNYFTAQSLDLESTVSGERREIVRNVLKFKIISEELE